MAGKTLVALIRSSWPMRVPPSTIWFLRGYPRDSINLIANDSSRAYEGELAKDRNSGAPRS